MRMLIAMIMMAAVVACADDKLVKVPAELATAQSEYKA
jgi:hypothetical protein